MGPPQPVKKFTPQEYYRLERDADYRSEYYNGEIFAMGGGTTTHSRIVSNILGELRLRLKGKSCEALESNQRLKIMATGLRCYPDVSMYCGPLEYDEQDDQRETAVNPTLIFEVLPQSTEAYDEGFKSLNFRQISSLEAHVLMSQNMPHVQVYERQGKRKWLLSEEDRLDAAIKPSRHRRDSSTFGDLGPGGFPFRGIAVPIPSPRSSDLASIVVAISSQHRLSGDSRQGNRWDLNGRLNLYCIVPYRASYSLTAGGIASITS